MKKIEKRSSKSSLPWDILSTAGNLILMISGLICLSLPLINKKALSIAKAWTRFVSRLRPVSQKQTQRWSKLLADPKALRTSVLRVAYLGGFMQGINLYQIALDTRQPSLIAHALLSDLINFTAILYPKDFISIMGTLVSILYGVGKQTDIENSNHPNNRRDYDFTRLTGSLFKKDGQALSTTFYPEFKKMLHFIGQDLENAFSPQPWRKLGQSVQEKGQWQNTQPAYCALSAQLYAACSLISLTALRFKRTSLKITGALLAFFAALCNRIAFSGRAWQNRTELDGQMVLAAIPLQLTGNMFQQQFTKKWFFLNGLTQVGNPISIKGLRLNAQKYRRLIRILEELYAQASQQLDLTAHEVRQAYQNNPQALSRLRKRIGESRYTYLMNLLQQAETAQRTRGISFATFLKPLAQSHE